MACSYSNVCNRICHSLINPLLLKLLGQRLAKSNLAEAVMGPTSSLKTIPDDIKSSPKRCTSMPLASFEAKSMPEFFRSSMLSWAYMSSESLNSLSADERSDCYRLFMLKPALGDSVLSQCLSLAQPEVR